MFILLSVALILIVSFILALRSLKNLDEKPEIGDVKKSLDKSRVIFHSHSSSE